MRRRSGKAASCWPYCAASPPYTPRMLSASDVAGTTTTFVSAQGKPDPEGPFSYPEPWFFGRPLEDRELLPGRHVLGGQISLSPTIGGLHNIGLEHPAARVLFPNSLPGRFASRSTLRQRHACLDRAHRTLRRFLSCQSASSRTLIDSLPAPPVRTSLDQHSRTSDPPTTQEIFENNGEDQHDTKRIDNNRPGYLERGDGKIGNHEECSPESDPLAGGFGPFQWT